MTKQTVLAELARTLESKNYTSGSIPSSVIDNSPVSGFRNKIINGDFSIWQRGTFFTTTFSYTADRWGVYMPSGNVYIERRSAIGSKWGYSAGILHMYYSANGTSSPAIYQKIEDARTLANKQVTIGIRCTDPSSSNLTLQVYVVRDYGVGGSSREIIVSQTDIGNISSSSVNYHKYTFTLPDVENKTFGSGHYIEVGFRVKENKAFTVQFGSAFLVEGDATDEIDPFSPRHIKQELALCKWYAQPAGRGGVGKANTTSGGSISYTNPPMRRTPTATVIDGSGVNGLIRLSGTNETANTVLGSPIGPDGGFFQFTGSGYIVGDIYMSANNMLFLDAEL